MRSDVHTSRYHRQIILPDLGQQGQSMLSSASVLVAGAGGLGCPALLYLAAAGVGRIGVIDHDVVELSNLHRQVLYTSDDLGENKARAAVKHLQARNPEVQYDLFAEKLTSQNAFQVVEAYDIVIDGTDNFPSRYLINDACVLLDKTLVYGAIYQFEGQVSVFNHLRKDGTRGPNYRDLYPEPPAPGQVPNCNETGVIGVLPGIIGNFQANETLKIILGWEHVLDGELLLFDVRELSTVKIKVSKTADNPLTGKIPVQHALIDYDTFCSIDDDIQSITKSELHQLQKSQTELIIVDVREEYEIKADPFPNTTIHVPMSNFNFPTHIVENESAIVFVCRTGRRSKDAIRRLRGHLDHRNLFNLAGGIEE